jgi:hypothetical protein
MKEEELKKDARIARQLSHIFNELEEGHQNIVGGIIRDLHSRLDQYDYGGLRLVEIAK